MKLAANPVIIHCRQDLLDSMASYMNVDSAGSDAPYTQNEIDACARIIDDLLAALASLGAVTDSAAILAQVKKAVLALNDLNDEAGGSLIETGERESLCDIIILAAKDAGLESGEDITEEWRDW